MKTSVRVSILSLVLASLLGTTYAKDHESLNGEWEAVVSSATFGQKQYLVQEPYSVKIFNEEDGIVCECLTSGKRFSKGEKIMKATLAGSVFESVYVNAVQDPVQFTLGWVKGNGVILDDGNTIVAQIFNQTYGTDVTIMMKKKVGK